jgi:gag-polypeptide of LTR copia-type/Pol polyprotein, beta-barrel domain
MSDEFKIQVMKLAADGSNWVTYCDQIMWALDVKGLLEHLMSDVIMSDYSAASTVDGLTLEARWKKDEAMVKQLVASSVPDTVFSQIKAGLKAKEVWDQLRALYEGQTKLILVDLWKRLQNTHCGVDDDVHAHFDKLLNLKEQLAAMGTTIMDEEYGNILLGSLPNSYNNTINSIMAAMELSGRSITPTLVIQLMTDEYDRQTLKKGKAKLSTDKAFHANRQRKGQRNVECFNCHQKGHFKADCWAKGEGKEGQGPHGSPSSRMGAEESTSAATHADVEAWATIEAVRPQPDVTAIMNEQTNSPTYAEIYDSGATRHMSPYREQFINYHPIDPHPILAANNHIFHAIGASNLKIQVPNEGKFTPVILHDALHAPELGLMVI